MIIYRNWWSIPTHGYWSEVEFYEFRRLFMTIDDRCSFMDIEDDWFFWFFDGTDDNWYSISLMVMELKVKFVKSDDYIMMIMTDAHLWTL